MPGMAAPPPAVVQAAAMLRLDPSRVRPLGGYSGSAWDAGDRVLRVGHRPRMDTEQAAMAAAAGVLPVPRVIDWAEFGEMAAVLLERLPGQPALAAAARTPALAREVGRACGAVHALLAKVPAPPRLPAAPATTGAGAGARLLHLDLHPLNILVSGGGTEVTGVLDWANATAGDPVLDQARSWAILTLDPAARARRAKPGWRALAEGWAEAGALDALPASARAWACRFMLTDLARRYPPGDLAHVRQALHQAQTAAE
jgi:aminoglycoside phosphotransferase (APT) family kinase protein